LFCYKARKEVTRAGGKKCRVNMSRRWMLPPTSWVLWHFLACFITGKAWFRPFLVIFCFIMYLYFHLYKNYFQFSRKQVLFKIGVAMVNWRLCETARWSFSCVSPRPFQFLNCKTYLLQFFKCGPRTFLDIQIQTRDFQISFGHN